MVSAAEAGKADFELSDAQEKLERQNRHGDGALMSADQIEIARQNAALREEMATLAARMVAITAEREGPDSPIHKLLKGTALTEKGKGKKNKAPKSLATRIRDMAIEHFRAKSVKRFWRENALASQNIRPVGIARSLCLHEAATRNDFPTATACIQNRHCCKCLRHAFCRAWNPARKYGRWR